MIPILSPYPEIADERRSAGISVASAEARTPATVASVDPAVVALITPFLSLRDKSATIPSALRLSALAINLSISS